MLTAGNWFLEKARIRIACENETKQQQRQEEWEMEEERKRWIGKREGEKERRNGRSTASIVYGVQRYQTRKQRNDLAESNAEQRDIGTGQVFTKFNETLFSYRLRKFKYLSAKRAWSQIPWNDRRTTDNRDK